ncbi:hypothetical protein HDU87_008456 [Geranomyces variabilis]|uniref:Transmembrane protein n=1 Tax=Geranomyces variabilis TaxID=109894 RepID=A0AAD5TPB6_9FUNG|nr:hypothetical protein HDU87_008456 [Geranomyces variabilis]
MASRSNPPDTPPTQKPTQGPPTPPADPTTPVVEPTKPPVVVPPPPVITPIAPPPVIVTPPPVVISTPPVVVPVTSAPPPVVVTETRTRSTSTPVASDVLTPGLPTSRTLAPAPTVSTGDINSSSLSATPGATDTSLAVGASTSSSALGVGPIIAIVCAISAVLITALAFVCFRRRRGLSESRLRNDDRVDFNNPSGHGSLWRQALKKPSLGRTPGAGHSAVGASAATLAMASPVTSTAALVPPPHMLGHEYDQRPISPAHGAYYQDPALAYEAHHAAQQYYQDPNHHASYDPYYQDPNQPQQQPYYGDYYDQPAGQPYYAADAAYYDHHESYDPNTVDAGEFPTGARPVHSPPSS